MAAAMLIMSVQNVMAMAANQAGCGMSSNNTETQQINPDMNPHQGHIMDGMEPSDNSLADNDSSSGADCCSEQPCTDMVDNCDSGMQVSSLILSHFEFHFATPADAFTSSDTTLPDLPPLPPIKPPV